MDLLALTNEEKRKCEDEKRTAKIKAALFQAAFVLKLWSVCENGRKHD
jgi:hypothetical protein